MGKPLKGTGIDGWQGEKAHYDEHIISAIEWLKEQLIKKMETKYKGKICYPYTFVGDTIDKAFPDLIHVPHTKRGKE